MRIGLAALGVGIVVGLAAAPAFAHHPFAAEFDANRLVTLTGTVTKVEWKNPHVFVYMDVKDETGTVKNWAFEMGSPHALMEAGWTQSLLKGGDQVTVQGWLAKEGGTRAAARSLTFDGKALSAAPSFFDQQQETQLAAVQPNEITTIGCVEFESDYRDTRAGRALRTDADPDHEFVVTGAMPWDNAIARLSVDPSSPDVLAGQTSSETSTVGTSGTSTGPGGTTGEMARMAYSLTGDQEDNLRRHVGKMVEITGVIEHRSSLNRADQINDLPPLRITAWHPIADYCTAQ